MALIRAYTANDSPFGIAIPECYIRIVSAEFDEANRITVTLHFWASQAIYESEVTYAPWKTSRQVMNDFDQNYPGNIKTALYGWLKTLPEFASAADA